MEMLKPFYDTLISVISNTRALCCFYWTSFKSGNDTIVPGYLHLLVSEVLGVFSIVVM